MRNNQQRFKDMLPSGRVVRGFVQRGENSFSLSSSANPIKAIQCELCERIFEEWGTDWMRLKNKAIEAGWYLKKGCSVCPNELCRAAAVQEDQTDQPL